MTLRDRLAAKQRRHATYPVQVSDPGRDADRVAAAQQALTTAEFVSTTTRERREELSLALEEAQAAYAEHFENLEFQALPGDEFEALFNAHLVEDAEGEADVNSRALLPVLAGACAVDESLQDADWWSAELEKPQWTKGEKDQLYYVLFTQLHYSVPRAVVGKG